MVNLFFILEIFVIELRPMALTSIVAWPHIRLYTLLIAYVLGDNR